MEILWLLIGVVIGVLIAWFFFGADYRKQLAVRDAELLEEKRRVEQALERERETQQQAKARLSDAQAKQASAVERATGLETELEAARDELERLKALDAERGAKLAHTQADNADLEARLKELEAARRNAGDDSRAQIAGLQTQLRAKEEKIAVQEAELAALRTKTAASPPRRPAFEPEGTPEKLQGAAPTSGPMDDLTKIKGIGPVLKEKLYRIGITSFQQIADFAPADIERVNGVLDFPGRIEREQWVEQARAMVRR